MYELLHKELLAPGIVLLKIKAPDVAAKVRPGQFIIVRVDEYGERVPLSVADWDDESVTVIVQDVGVSTRKLSLMAEGDYLLNLAGPLGKPSQIINYGKVAVVCGCFGIGPGFALARALKSTGNKVIIIVEVRSRDWLFWLDRLMDVSDRLMVTYNEAGADDSCATGPLMRLLESENIDRIYGLGCTFMMMELSRATEPSKVETRVSLMPLMVDGTGMCGACRCSVNGKVQFGCVDGPEFDGHKVNWNQLIERMRSYLDEENRALDLWDRMNWHKAINRKQSLQRA